MSQKFQTYPPPNPGLRYELCASLVNECKGITTYNQLYVPSYMYLHVEFQAKGVRTVFSVDQDLCNSVFLDMLFGRG